MSATRQYYRQDRTFQIWTHTGFYGTHKICMRLRKENTSIDMAEAHDALSMELLKSEGFYGGWYLLCFRDVIPNRLAMVHLLAFTYRQCSLVKSVWIWEGKVVILIEEKLSWVHGSRLEYSILNACMSFSNKTRHEYVENKKTISWQVFHNFLSLMIRIMCLKQLTVS